MRYLVPDYIFHKQIGKKNTEKRICEIQKVKVFHTKSKREKMMQVKHCIKAKIEILPGKWKDIRKIAGF